MSNAWPQDFDTLKRGEDCPMCANRGVDDSGFGVRFMAGRYADAYLQRADLQRGYAVVIWNGEHVCEPTQLSDEDAAGYWAEVLRAGRAVEQHFEPLKMNYLMLGNAVPHLHTHLMPRYEVDPAPGAPFPFPSGPEPDQPEDRLQADVAALTRSLA